MDGLFVFQSFKNVSTVGRVSSVCLHGLSRALLCLRRGAGSYPAANYLILFVSVVPLRAFIVCAIFFACLCLNAFFLVMTIVRKSFYGKT